MGRRSAYAYSRGDLAIIVAMSSTRGRFIAIDGTDGSGGSTQASLLAGYLRAQGASVLLTKEPSTGPAGALARLVLTGRLGRPVTPFGSQQDATSRFAPLDEETLALVFAADRLDHVATEIAPRLAAGIDVVCDRYVLSTYAFQGASLPLDWLQSLNSRARIPDLSVFIDVPAEVSVARMRSRESVERYEQLETLRRVRETFHRVIPTLQAEGQRVAIVDGTMPQDSVHEAIVTRMRKSE